MDCLACGTKMNQENVDGTPVDVCHKCNSLWLDSEKIVAEVHVQKESTLEQRKLAVLLRGKDAAQTTPRKCPKCQSALNTMNYAYNSGIMVDVCPKNHGMFLDSGELDRLRLFFATMDAPKSAPGSSGGQRLCPRDHHPLQSKRYESQNVDICTWCGGTWCDDSELLAIVQERSKTISKEIRLQEKPDEKNTKISSEVDLQEQIPCVVCKRPMEAENFGYNSGIIIQHCRAGHGVWLDKMELEQIQAFVEGWEDRGDLQDKYQNILTQSAADAGAHYDKAIADAKKKGQMDSKTGRILNWFQK